MRAWRRRLAHWWMTRRARGSLKQRARFVDATALDARTRHLLHLSPRAGRGGFASGALAKRSKSGEGALPQPETRGHAPSPGFLRSAALRLESDLSPHAGRGGASGMRVAKAIGRELPACGRGGASGMRAAKPTSREFPGAG